MSALRDKRIAITILVILLLAISLTAFVFREGHDEQWAAMISRISQLQSEAQSRDVSRSVLTGKAMPGNSWDEYRIALDDVHGWTEDPNGVSLAEFITGGPNADNAKIEKMVASHGAALEHLRLGAQRHDGQYPYKWAYDDETEVPSLIATRLIGALAIAQAKIWGQSGRSGEAVELLLDVSVFARDLATNGPLTTHLAGTIVYSMTFDQLRDLILSGKLTKTQIADLHKKLEIMDHDFPVLSATLANETLATSASAMKTARDDWWELLKQDGWRYGFSSRRMTLDAFEKRESYLQRSLNIDQVDFATAKKEAEAIEAEVDESPNPMIRLSTPSLSRAIVKQRETLARLRLLQAATGFLSTGKVPPLADPFGTNLNSTERLQLTIWSVGSDGNDNQGHGGWNSMLPDQDIVVEIPLAATK